MGVEEMTVQSAEEYPTRQVTDSNVGSKSDEVPFPSWHQHGSTLLPRLRPSAPPPSALPPSTRTCDPAMPGRRGRGASRAARPATRTPTPAVRQLSPSDVDMLDADADADASPAVNPPSADEDEPATPAQDSDAQNDDASSQPEIQTIPRKRRPGRRSRVTRSDWNTPEPGADDGLEPSTSQRRRRGRPSVPGSWRGGFRGRARGGPSHVTRVPIDKEGNTMEVIDDEVALPEDPEGETKVDKYGRLLGGRDYRVRTFTLLGRGDRLYMLSTEPARCTGFRDSYLFFTKHLALYKIIIDEAEKKDLISRSLIPHSYKGRAIGVVTARSVFREFGAKIIIGGRKVIDDYHAQAARDRGETEGELVDPYDRLPAPSELYNKNQYVAWHGASQVYHTGQPSVPAPSGKVMIGKRKNVTPSNWQFEHANEASRYNAALTALRRVNLDGIYDPHTNTMHQPKIMQPTHAKWEVVLPPSSWPSNTKGSYINGHAPPDNGSASAIWCNSSEGADQTSFCPTSRDVDAESTFTAVPPVISRNFLVTDTYFESPPIPHPGIPGPDGDAYDLGPNGLSSVPDGVLAELPPDCRTAFEAAKKMEGDWKGQWGSEARDGGRGTLRIGFTGFPDWSWFIHNVD
ncbi:chromatin structure-remodeling complex subunit RSC7 [Elasticomyces elasticus]|nr:chromatin structure-remodeling complex subunit RSC7 [Elasticomyces elasticus]